MAYGGAYDRWTLEDIRDQYSVAENFVCLHPVRARRCRFNKAYAVNMMVATANL